MRKLLLGGQPDESGGILERIQRIAGEYSISLSWTSAELPSNKVYRNILLSVENGA